KKRTGQKNQPRLVAALSLAALLAAAALLLFPAAAWAQTKPISREGLVKAVRINGLSTAELIQQIQTRGVSFQMTPDAEAELRNAGARPEVIEAALRSSASRSEEHTSELQSPYDLVCRLLLEKKK